MISEPNEKSLPFVTFLLNWKIFAKFVLLCKSYAYITLASKLALYRSLFLPDTSGFEMAYYRNCGLTRTE